MQSDAHEWFDSGAYIQPLRGNYSYEVSHQPLMPVYQDDLKYARYLFRSPHFDELALVLSRAFERIQSGQQAAAVMRQAQQEALGAVR